MDFVSTTFKNKNGSIKWDRADYDAAAPAVLKAMELTAITIDDLRAVLYDTERAGVADDIDVRDFLQAKAAANKIRTDPDTWSIEQMALMMHLEHLKMSLRERA